MKAGNTDFLLIHDKNGAAPVLNENIPILVCISAKRGNIPPGKIPKAPPNQWSKGTCNVIIGVKNGSGECVLMDEKILFSFNIFLHCPVNIQMVRRDVCHYCPIGCNSHRQKLKTQLRRLLLIGRQKIALTDETVRRL